MKINLNIGKALVSILRGVTDFKGIAPCVLVEGVKYPFCVYRRTNAETTESKDISAGILSADFDVMIVSESYDESLTIAQEVINALEHRRGTFGDITLLASKVTNVTEDYQNDAFVQDITVTLKYQ